MSALQYKLVVTHGPNGELTIGSDVTPPFFIEAMVAANPSTAIVLAEARGKAACDEMRQAVNAWIEAHRGELEGYGSGDIRIG